MTDHARGLLLTALGVLVVSPDSLLIRLADTDVMSVAVWRGLLQAIGLTFLLACFYRRRIFQVFAAIGWLGALIAVVFSANTFAFLAAVKYTSVANTLVILATTPLFAAILSLVFLKEPVALRTWLAILAAVCGIGLIVWDSLGGGGLFGDLMAVLAAALLALKVTIVRGRRDINMIPALALSGLVFALLAAPFASPAQVTGEQMIWLLLMGFAVITPATALITLGPRYISAPEVGLLFLLETAFGPLWVWLVLSETPSALSLLGGFIVVASLMIHALWGLRLSRPAVAGFSRPP